MERLQPDRPQESDPMSAVERQAMPVEATPAQALRDASEAERVDLMDEFARKTWTYIDDDGEVREEFYWELPTS